MAASDLPVQVHRLALGRLLAVLWFVGVGLALFDITRRGMLGTYGGWALLLVSSALVAYTFGLRPAVVENPSGLVVRNPVRTVEVPWSAVTDTDATDVLRVHAGATVVRCFAVPYSRPARSAKSSGGTAGGTLTGLSPLPAAQEAPGQARGPGVGRGALLADRIMRLAEQYGSGDPRPVGQAWAPDGAGAMAAALVLVLVAAVLR